MPLANTAAKLAHCYEKAWHSYTTSEEIHHKSTRIAFQRWTGVRVSPREKREGEVIVIGVGDVCEHRKAIIHKPCFYNQRSKVCFVYLLRLDELSSQAFS